MFSNSVTEVQALVNGAHEQVQSSDEYPDLVTELRLETVQAISSTERVQSAVNWQGTDLNKELSSICSIPSLAQPLSLTPQQACEGLQPIASSMQQLPGQLQALEGTGVTSMLQSGVNWQGSDLNKEIPSTLPIPSLAPPRSLTPRQVLEGVQSKVTSPQGVDGASVVSTRVEIEDEFGAKPVRICTFQIKSGASQKGVAKAAFWPAGKPLSPEKLGEVLFQTWGLERPNLIIGLDAGTAHPSKLSTKSLRSLPQFQRWSSLAELQRQFCNAREKSPPGYTSSLGQSQSRLPGEPDHTSPSFNAASDHSPMTLPTLINEDDYDAFEKNQETVVNECIFNKLVSIIAAIIDASAKTNNYIVVDRTTRTGSSSTAELLLELALEHTEAAPVVLVVDRMSRLQKYHSHEAKHQLEVIHRLGHLAIPHGTDTPLRKIDVAPLYTADEFLNDSTFRGGKYEDRPLPTRPDPDHILEPGKGVQVDFWEAPDVVGYNNGKVGTACLNPKRLWQYHYSQYVFAAGTHYIFLEDDTHVFPSEAIGPVGAVFAHGGTLSCKRMNSWLRQGKPAVMLWNSGGVTQAFASLHNAIVRSDVVDFQTILPMIEITSAENWATKFGLSECIMMAELKKRAPFFIKKAMVSVDILDDSAEDVLQVVTGCFSFGVNRLPELGLRTAEAHSVLRAWKQHLILYASAKQMKRMSDFFFFLQTLLLALTAVIAAFKAEVLMLQTVDNDDDWSSSAFVDESLYISAIACPILVGLVSSAMQQRRFLEKWCKLWSSSMCIVTEIYKFRARVLEYDDASPMMNGPSRKDDDPDSGVLEPARKSRVKFVRRIQQIFANAAEGEMNSDPLSIGRSLDDATSPIDELFLKSHVQQNLLHRRPNRKTCQICNCRRRSPPESLCATIVPTRNNKDTKDIYNDIDDDDFKTTFSIEEYIEHRMKPLMEYFGTKSPDVSFRLQAMSGLSAILNAAIVALALPRGVNISHWLTLCVSVKVLIMNVIDYLAYAVQLTALNSGVKELQNLLTWWESLSVIDRRTRQAKTQAVSVVEQATLKAFLARTGEVPSVFATSVTKNDEHKAEGEDKSEAKSDKVR